MENELGFKKLNVWKLSLDFADNVLDCIENLNSDRKHFRLIEQLESAAVSVSLNIAEGKGRYSNKEFIHFLYIARGSLYETISLLMIFERRRWITPELLKTFEDKAIEIAKKINALINSIKRSLQ